MENTYNVFCVCIATIVKRTSNNDMLYRHFSSSSFLLCALCFHISLYFHSPAVAVKNSRPHVIQNPYNSLHSNCSLIPSSHEATLVKPTA